MKDILGEALIDFWKTDKLFHVSVILSHKDKKL